MRQMMIAAALMALGGLLMTGTGCGRSEFVHAGISAPMVTGATGNETVWWAEHRASRHGYNDTRVIMCRQGADPVCVRWRVRDVD